MVDTSSTSRVYVLAVMCYAALLAVVVGQQSLGSVRSECVRELDASGTNGGSVSPMKVMACIFKKEGIMTDDGRYSRAKAVEIAHAAFSDQNALAAALRAAEECETEIGEGGETDEETAAMMVECFARNGHTRKN